MVHGLRISRGWCNPARRRGMARGWSSLIGTILTLKVQKRDPVPRRRPRGREPRECVNGIMRNGPTQPDGGAASRRPNKDARPPPPLFVSKLTTSSPGELVKFASLAFSQRTHLHFRSRAVFRLAKSSLAFPPTALPVILCRSRLLDLCCSC